MPDTFQKCSNKPGSSMFNYISSHEMKLPIVGYFYWRNSNLLNEMG